MDILRRYFYGQLSPEEEEKVKDWILDHGREPEVEEALFQIMAEMEQEDEGLSAEAFDRVCKRLGMKRRTQDRRKTVLKPLKVFWRIAGCIGLLLVGGLTYALVYQGTEPDWREARVPYGEKKELILSDGTRLFLNAGSKVVYPEKFRGRERRIFIEGEVYADVAKSKRQPFCIDAGDIDVKVLGTKFNLKAFDDAQRVELLLFDGSVEFGVNSEKRKKNLVLRPGEMVQYDRVSGEIDLKDFAPKTYKNFHDSDAIHFFNLPLSDIVADLERLFGVKIVIMDESLSGNRYFAWFTNGEDIYQILRGLDVDEKMNFTAKGHAIYISPRPQTR